MSDFTNNGGEQFNAPRGIQNFVSPMPKQNRDSSIESDGVRNTLYVASGEGRSLEKVVDALHQELAQKGERIDRLDSEISELRIKLSILDKDYEALTQVVAMISAVLEMQTLDVKGYISLSTLYLIHDRERFSIFVRERAGR